METDGSLAPQLPDICTRSHRGRFPPFRRFIRSTLGKKPGLRVVSEVSDGREAVQKAAELRPDLVLMDVGLPTMNGIEAARQIRKLSPESKIVFLSQESSADFVEEDFGAGNLITLPKRELDRAATKEPAALSHF